MEKHNRQVFPVKGNIQLADASQTLPGVGRTECLEVEYNKHVVGVPFEIINNCSHDFIMGMDIFHKLGLGVSGLENLGKDANTLPEPMEDVKPSLIPGVIPEEEKHASFQKLKALFLATI